MNEIFQTVVVTKDSARGWFEESLRGGFGISAAVLAACQLDRGFFYTFLPSVVPATDFEFPEYGKVGETVGDAGLAKHFDGLTKRGASSLVFEDDIAGPTAAGIDSWSAPSAFMGDRLVHWVDLKPESGVAAVEAIRGATFGYPLNAFVCSIPPSELGLAHKQAVAEDLPDQVAESLLAIVVSAFDAESFGAWDQG